MTACDRMRGQFLKAFCVNIKSGLIVMDPGQNIHEINISGFSTSECAENETLCCCVNGPKISIWCQRDKAGLFRTSQSSFPRTSVRQRGGHSPDSAVSACSVVLLLLLFLPPIILDIISHFDSTEGVVDGSAVGPAPGSG